LWQFRRECGRDLTGRTILQEVTGLGLDELQANWLAWVNTLTYEP